MIGDTVRCIDCGRPVRALGGAWCETHRPLDLTGGVMPWDRPTPRKSTGYAPTARAVYGEVPAMLAARGWERVDREGKAYWRSPHTGVVHSQETARSKEFRVKVASPDAPRRAPGGQKLSPANPTTLHWMSLVDAGVSVKQIAREHGVPESTIYERVRLARARGAA